MREKYLIQYMLNSHKLSLNSQANIVLGIIVAFEILIFFNKKTNLLMLYAWIADISQFLSARSKKDKSEGTKMNTRYALIN